MKSLCPILALACLSTLSALPAPANAQSNQFSTSSQFAVDPSFNSGMASGSGGGSNAIVMNLSSNTDLYIDPIAEEAYLNASVYVSGVWGNVSTVSPYYSHLEYPGLTTYSSLALTTVKWNGTFFEFDNPVELNLNGFAGLSRDPEHTWLYGYSYANAYGEGAIPIDSSSWYHIYEPGHPNWLPDWEVTFTSRWLVTESFGPIPTPGSLCLLGLGGLVALRRRR